MSNEAVKQARANIRVRPTWILAAAGAGGIGLHAAVDWSYTTGPHAEQWLTWIGYVLMGFGMLLIFASDRYFSRHGTETDCGAPDTALVTTGPYRLSRNPIYVAFAIIFLGCSLSSNAPGFALVAAPMMVALRQLVVMPEEAHLEAIFGDAYRAYAQRVRRWI